MRQMRQMSITRFIIFAVVSVTIVSPEQFTQYPQGYYPFEESPAKIPPKVRKPPYLQTQVNCPGVNDPNIQEQTLDNLCGDLNKGYLPLNPIGQTVEGVSYPFDLMKRETLEFFSKTLPILKADDTLPKVAKYENAHISYHPTLFNSKPSSKISFYHHRSKRDASTPSATLDNPSIQTAEDATSKHDNERKAYLEQSPRQGRGWCKDSHGVFCMLYNVFKGNKEKQSAGASDRIGDEDIPSLSSLNSLDSPMTPCPSAVEYVTPVFAKNYQGVWRYVVQIPYEGYFTQTVEVVKCLSTKCEYLDGSCLASPRWVSLLVAEIYYPDVSFPNPGPSQNRNPVKGATPPNDYNQLFLKRQGGAPLNGPISSASATTTQQKTPPSKCDGQDDLGCYQVRLYYDWFLIPGSCKCWKNDFFDQYTKRK